MIDESTPAQKREIRALFDALGVDYAEVTFSGGNDEGGAERIECIMRGTGERVTAEPKHVNLKQVWDAPDVPYGAPGWRPGEWRDGPETAAIRASISPATKLANLLDEVPGWRYGSFAGDFYVSGMIRVERDGATIVAKFSGEEEFPHTESFEDDL